MDKLLLTNLGPLGLEFLKIIHPSDVDIFVSDGNRINIFDVESGYYQRKYFGKPRIEVFKKIKESSFFKIINRRFLKPNDLDEYDLVVSCCDNFSLDFNNLMNQLIFSSNKPWISARLINNFSSEIGPFVIPHKTNCFKCLELRIKGNLEDHRIYFQSSPNFSTSDFQYIFPTLIKVTSYLLKLEVDNFLKNRYTNTISKVITLDLSKCEMRIDKVFKIPNCPICDNE